MAIEQGVDTIEHGLSLHRAPELLATMAERGHVLVPTLPTFHDLSERVVTCFGRCWWSRPRYSRRNFSRRSRRRGPRW